MLLTARQKKIITDQVAPRLGQVGIWAEIGPGCDPDMGGTKEDCLYVWGWPDNLYRMVRKVDEILLEVNEEFAELLVVVADAVAKPQESRVAAAQARVDDATKVRSTTYSANPEIENEDKWTILPVEADVPFSLGGFRERCIAA